MFEFKSSVQNSSNIHKTWIFSIILYLPPTMFFVNYNCRNCCQAFLWSGLSLQPLCQCSELPKVNGLRHPRIFWTTDWLTSYSSVVKAQVCELYGPNYIMLLPPAMFSFTICLCINLFCTIWAWQHHILTTSDILRGKIPLVRFFLDTLYYQKSSFGLSPHPGWNLLWTKCKANLN